MKKSKCVDIFKQLAEAADSGYLHDAQAVRSAIEHNLIAKVVRQQLARACGYCAFSEDDDGDLNSNLKVVCSTHRDREWKSGALMLIACMTEVYLLADD